MLIMRMIYYLLVMTHESKSLNFIFSFCNSLYGHDFYLFFNREFVSFVPSIKILSYSEVQQMSLDGDLGNMPVPNQASSWTDSGNPWKGQCEDNSATSFNR